MPAVPETLRAALSGRYELEEVVGRGGMATVYRAHDPKHGRRVAVKVLRDDVGEAIGPERFLREIEIAARLTHPNILPLYDSGDAGGQLYYVMPFIEDETLRGLLSRVRLMDTDGAVEIVRRVADALDYAHGAGIVHRDIKPENILLPGGQPVVADFGIAKAASGATGPGLTRTGFALGTPGYMSPEQAAGMVDLGPATDVYALGVVAYEMLVGEVPRSWVTPDFLAQGRFLDAAPQHRTQLDRLPPGIERALLRALALRPEGRYPTTGDFAAALAAPETLSQPVRSWPDDFASDVPAVRETPHPSTSRTSAAKLAPHETESGILGAPTTVVADRVVQAEVPSEALDDLVEEVRVAFRAVGHSSSTDRGIIWTARRPKESGSSLSLDNMFNNDDEMPDVLARVSVRHGRTRIHLEHRLGHIAGGVFGGVWGGGGGGGLGVIFGVGLGALGLPVALVFAGAFLWVGSTYSLSRSIYRSVVRAKQNALETLADRLAEQCEDAIE